MTTGSSDPYFFLSFATSNSRDDALVLRFFRDLGDEVRAAAGLRPDQGDTVGFLSMATLRLGADWWNDLREALDGSATFVALCAPTYFTSPACGKEWRSFTDRLAAHRAARGGAAPCLLPVPWLRGPMPEVVAGLQYVDRSLSPTVHETGLRDLMLLHRYRDDYAAFTGALARHVVGLARRHSLPRGRTTEDYDRQPQAFPVPGGHIPTARTATDQPPVAPAPVDPPDLRDDRFPRLQSP
ncbi:MAG: TIR-like protein FxsC [Actinoplanes sp.]